jgi:hypothetical protein
MVRIIRFGTLWLLCPALFVFSQNCTIVPDQYTTINEALNHDSIICIRGNLTQNVSINSKKCIIASLDSQNISSITGTFTITSSNVTLNKLSLVGTGGTGGSGGCVLSGPCPTATAGGNGSVAFSVNNSIVTLTRCQVIGGHGGIGGYSGINPCNIPCACGKPGNGGLGISITHSALQADEGSIKGGPSGVGAGTMCSGMVGTGKKGFGITAQDSSKITANGATIDTFTFDATSSITVIPPTQIAQLGSNSNNKVVGKNSLRKQVVLQGGRAPIVVYDALGRKAFINFSRGTTKVKFVIVKPEGEN